MLSILFLFGIRVEVDSDNAKQIVANSKKIPTFLLLYSHYCGFCQQVLPKWDQLMEMYENDTSIVVGKINCIQNKVCNSISHNLVGFPTFNTYLRGKPKSIRPNRTIETFIDIVENLKQVKMSVPCYEYPYEIGNDYPSFVVSVDKDENRCDKVKQLKRAFPNLKEQIYYQYSPGKKSLFAVVSKNANITYDGDFSQNSINDFIKEYSLVSFGKWALNAADHSIRRFMFIVYKNYYIINQNRFIMEKHEDSLLIGCIELKVLNQTYPELVKKIETPAIFIASRTKKSFHMISNFNETSKLQAIIEDVADGKYDEEGEVQIPKIFQPSPEYLNYIATGIKGKSIRSTTIGILIAILIALIVVLIAVLLFIRKRPVKIE